MSVHIAGVVAGSTAAAVQGSIGNVAAGSMFAALQSAGAAGLSGATTACVGGFGAAAGAAIPPSSFLAYCICSVHSRNE